MLIPTFVDAHNECIQTIEYWIRLCHFQQKEKYGEGN